METNKIPSTVGTSATTLLEAVSQAHHSAALGQPKDEIGARLLDQVLRATGSEWGFIAEVNRRAEEATSLRPWAVRYVDQQGQTIPWPGTAAHLTTSVDETTLVGAALSGGQAEAIRAEDSGELPPAYLGISESPNRRPTTSLVALPFGGGDKPLGVIGLANRPGGYDSDLVAELQSIATTCTALVEDNRARSERRQSLAALTSSEARAGTVLQVISNPLIIIDSDGVIDTFNRAAEQCFGYQSHEVEGSNVSMLMTQDDAMHHDRYVAESSKVGRRDVLGLQRELIGRRKDGSTFPMALTVQEVQLEGVKHFVGICRDLTEERRVHRLMAMHASIIDNTSDFVGLAGIDGQVVFVNPAGRAMVGMALDDPLDDMVIGDIHTDESRKLLTEVAVPTALNDGVWRGETAFKGPDGVVIPMSQLVITIPGPSGTTEFIAAIARDITEMKKLSQVKDEFVSTISHELRTPLTSIRGSLGLINGGVLGDIPTKAAEMLSLAQDNTERLIRLVSNILDFQKSEAGKLELQRTELDPSVIVDTCLQAMEGSALEAGVSLVAAVPDGTLPPVLADLDRMVQVLINLTGNAIKFSPEGSKVVVGIERKDDSETCFTVSDEGPGIPQKDMRRLFLPFQQLDQADNRGAEGSGLGLAIAQAIAEAHNGEITVASEVGTGSTFTVHIPDLLTTLDCKDPSMSQPDVLLVEHDESTRTVLLRQLEACNLDCIVASRASDALALAQSHQPLVIVTDVNLPDMTAFEMVEAFAQGDNADIPLVVYTGIDLSAAERKALTLGPTVHLLKARDTSEELANAVLRSLRERRRRHDAGG